MLQSQFIGHITTAGERWDLLAWKYYGDASLYSPIVMANPDIPIEPAFESGLAIAIPLLQVSRSVTTNLPPWKLGQ
jgi:phage tail protein X